MKKLFPLLLLLAFFACDKTTTQADLCQGVTCQNGGTCVNGDCNCPLGYTGPDCSNEKAPVKMKVGTIELTSFPPTDGGAGWDLTSGADVYLVIEKNNVELKKTDWIQNLTGNHAWTINLEFDDPTATYTIRVYDYDDGFGDDYMGGISFTPYRPGEKFPTSYFLSCSSCVVSFGLTGIQYFHV